MLGPIPGGILAVADVTGGRTLKVLAADGTGIDDIADEGTVGLPILGKGVQLKAPVADGTGIDDEGTLGLPILGKGATEIEELVDGATGSEGNIESPPETGV